MRTLTALIVVGVALVATVTPASGRDAGTTTACGQGKVGGASVVIWCGPAKATVKLSGKTFTFTGGKCVMSGGAWTVNVGRFTVPPAAPKFTHFGAAGTKTKAGTYSNGEYLVSFQLPGKQYAVQGGPVWGVPWPKVTVTSGGKKGAFSGSAFSSGLGKGTPVSGTWSC